jgi:Tol biopolymer transport system component/DNA-binding winged helix-turn-helix (wHTH) protein
MASQDESGPEVGARFRVGEWSVFADLHRVVRGGETRPVEPRVMETLVFLAQHAGRVVTRETLMDALWGDAIVGEAALTRAVSELRTLFGDDARDPRYIETIRKAGYRLIAEVAREDLLDPDGGAASEPPAAGFPARRTAGVALIVVALAVVGFWWARRGETEPVAEPALLAATPLTSYPGPEAYPALSPDGTKVAFMWTGGASAGQSDIYVKQRGVETPLRLTDHPGDDSFPVWSPDGTRIAFCRQTRGQPGIYSVPAIGGPARRLVATPFWPLGLDWSPDGTTLAYAVVTDMMGPDGLWLLTLETGEQRPLLEPPETFSGDTFPRYSPDGETIAFVRADAMAVQDLWLIPVAGGEPRRLTRGHRRIFGHDWTRDGSEIVFVSLARGNAELWRVAVSDGQLRPIPSAVESVTHLSLASGADCLVFADSRADADVWEIRQGESPDAPAELSPLITSTRWDCSGRFSPDGSRVAFVSARTGCREIWTCRRDGSLPVQVTSLDNPRTRNPQWSPDGRQIAFTSLIGENPAIYLVDSDGGLPRRLTDGTFREVASSWSRDGRWLYFMSDRGGDFQMWRMAPDGSEARQVTRQGAYVGYESHDGRILYHVKPRSAGIWRVPVEGGEEELIASYRSVGDCGNWAVAEDGIFFATYPRGGPVVRYYEFATGTTRTIAAVPGIVLGSLDVTPDGRSLLYGRNDLEAADLMLVDGFR